MVWMSLLDAAGYAALEEGEIVRVGTARSYEPGKVSVIPSDGGVVVLLRCGSRESYVPRASIVVRRLCLPSDLESDE